MRILPALVAVALLATTVLAHPEDTSQDEGLEHTTLWEAALPPGGTQERTLSYHGEPLREGWYMLWSGASEGALEARLSLDGEVVADSSWDGAVFTTLRLPEEGVYTMALSNVGDADAAFRLHYDITCRCTAKAVHGGGSLWFNLDAEKGQHVDWEFAVVPYGGQPDRGEVQVRATLAVADGAQEWDGFTVLDQVDLQILANSTDPYSTFGLPFMASQSGMHYVLLQLDHDGPQDWSFQVKPRWSVEPAVPEAAVPHPSLAVAGLVLLLLAVAHWRRR